jgi:hypothetical protein
VANFSQDQANRLLIHGGWGLLISHTLGMLVCVPLWMYDLLSERATGIITNLLSWEASILTALTFLLQALTKRDVNENEEA